MKNFLITIVFSVAVFGNSTYASGDEEVNFSIRQSFKKEFSSANNVHWEKIKDENIFKAQFIYNNERLCAFFDENGQLLVISRSIPAASLPLLVSKRINRRFSDYKLQEIMEYVNGGDTSYLLQLEKDRTRLIVQVYSNGGVQVYKKERIETEKK